MKILKKIWLLLVGFVLIGSLNFVNALPDGQPVKDSKYTTHDGKIWDVNVSAENDPIAAWSNITSQKVSGIIQLPQPENYQTSLWYAMALIQIAINWLLWMLASIALVYMLYCGFLIFLPWSDDKNTDKGKKWIKTAAIAIAWIGLSWLIISAMIWFINNIY